MDNMTFSEYKETRFNPQDPKLDRDIIEHLPFLEKLASECSVVVEFGVNNGHSTAALISGCKGKMYSYDIAITPAVNLLKNMELPCEWTFSQVSSIEVEIPQTDFLFIDSYHEYEHCKKELELHSNKVNKYIGFHDTVSFAEVSKYTGEPERIGLMPAIREFLSANPEWYIKHDFKNNNGLMILERAKSV